RPTRRWAAVLRYARARDCRLFRFRARLRSIVSGLRFDRSILRRFIRVWRRRFVLPPLRIRTLVIGGWPWLGRPVASTVIAPILSITTLRSTLGHNDALRSESGPRRTPINRRHFQLNHGRQRVTTSASNPGNTLGVH